MITAEQLKAKLDIINSFWKVMVQFAKCTGTDEECEQLQVEVDKLYESHGKVKFSQELAIVFINEIERIMMMNAKEN